MSRIRAKDLVGVAPVKNEYREVMNQLARHFPEINVPAPDPASSSAALSLQWPP